MIDWDKAHDWVLVRFEHTSTKIVIYFKEDIPAASELKAVKRLAPECRNASTMGLRKQIIGDGKLALHNIPISDAVKIISDLEQEGLNVILEIAFSTSYLPIDRTTNSAWLIEDELESFQVAVEMIAAGIPIEKDDEYTTNEY
jgi:hypothetical protein